MQQKHSNGFTRTRRKILLFSDIVMPAGMNGVLSAVELTRIRHEIHVVLTSGYTGEALMW